MQRVGVDTAGEHLAGGRHHIVVGARQPGDRVKQNHHVFFQFHQAFCTFDHHLGHMHVAGGGFVEGGGNHFTLDGALHFGHFFRALVNQQHHHVAVGIIGRNGVCDVLHHHRFTALGRCHQQGALAFADGGDDVDDAPGDVFLALDVAFQAHLHVGKQRRQVFKHHLVLVFLGAAAIDLFQLVQGKVTLAVLGGAHFTFDHVTGAGGIACVGTAQKAKTIRQDFQHTIGKNLFTGTGTLFDDGKHQLLLAHAAGVFNLEIFGLFEDF